jgi:hypothetical protein
MIIPPPTRSGLPSPSTSATLLPKKPVRTYLEANEPGLKLLPPGKVIVNGSAVYAVSPCVVTLIGEYIEPNGTVTVSVVLVAVNTLASTLPK